MPDPWIPLRLLNHFLGFLTGDGSWRLLLHEKIILDAALAYLDPDTRALAEKQLSQSYFVERGGGRRINVLRFYRFDEDIRIRAPGFDDHLIRVHLKVNGRKQIAHVTFYKGYAFSVETRKPAKYFKNAGLRVEKVSAGRAGETYTAAIDRFEHGRPEAPQGD